MGTRRRRRCAERRQREARAELRKKLACGWKPFDWGSLKAQADKRREVRRQEVKKLQEERDRRDEAAEKKHKTMVGRVRDWLEERAASRTERLMKAAADRRLRKAQQAAQREEARKLGR